MITYLLRIFYVPSRQQSFARSALIHINFNEFNLSRPMLGVIQFLMRFENENDHSTEKFVIDVR